MAVAGSGGARAVCVHCRRPVHDARRHICTSRAAELVRERAERQQRVREIVSDLASMRTLARADGLLDLLEAIDREGERLRRWVQGG